METVLIFRTGENETWLEKLSGISDCARDSNWNIQVVDARRVRINLSRLVGFWRPCGAIIDASGDTRNLRLRDFHRLPTVVMTPRRETDRFPSVTSNSRAIAKIAAVELLARVNQSHLFIDWPQNSIAWARSKREAFAGILAVHGYATSVFRPAEAEMRNRPALITRLSARLSSLPRPIGVFALTDVLGAAVLDAARHANLDVPRDLAVVGVDDNAFICENTRPTLSSVRPSFRRLGFTAGILLRQLLEQPKSPAGKVEVEPECLVRRASSAILRNADPMVVRAQELIRLRASDGLEAADVLKLIPGSRRLAELRFKAATGVSVRTAILKTRIARACGYLQSGRTSISAIANFCGWKSDLAFRSAFKAHVGQSPTAFRRAMPARGSREE